MINLIMLDLDGTLLDTDSLYFDGIPPIVLKYLNRRITKEDLLPLWGRLAKNFFVYFAKQAGVTDTALVDKMYDEFEQYYISEHKNSARTHDYVAEYLPKLKGLGCPIGIVTTRPAVRAKLIYELPWSRYIDFVVTGDQVKNRKPAPDSLDLAIAKYVMDNEGVSVYLGDNSIDVEASKASRNKIISAAALWGSAKRDQLLRSRPDKVFYTFREFSSWILEKESITISHNN